MNLRLRRLVRTPFSEQFALYRLRDEDSDENGKGNTKGEPITVGKVDMHFTDEGVFGTLLLWEDGIKDWDEETLNQFIRDLIEDMCEPTGMPDSYIIEFFAPSVDTYRFFTNLEEAD